jgi:Protein of unknown function (DUF3738)
VIWLHLFILAVNASSMRLVKLIMREIVALIGLTACGQSFEVASVKVGKPPARSSFGPLPGGERYRAVNAPLNWLISEAYRVPMRQISGLPPAFSSDGYDIDAKADHPVNRDQMLTMLQTYCKIASNLQSFAKRRK